jgi:hypothetical protein
MGHAAHLLIPMDSERSPAGVPRPLLVARAGVCKFARPGGPQVTPGARVNKMTHATPTGWAIRRHR